jgi:hypothetical protein
VRGGYARNVLLLAGRVRDSTTVRSADDARSNRVW